MTLPSSGPISLNDLDTEFGTGTNPNGPPLELSEYYRGTVNSSGFTSEVGPHNTTVPTSGTISLSQFYSTSAVIDLTVSTEVSDYDVKTAAGSPSGACSVYVNITTDGVCKGSSSGNYGLSINNFAAGSYIFIRNQGYIIGKGGTGGSRPSAGWSYNDSHPCGSRCIQYGTLNDGTAGGTAMFIQSGINVFIDNSGGVIGGGGGGGGAGGTTGGDCSSSSCGGIGMDGMGAGGGGAGYGDGGVTSFAGWCGGPTGSVSGSSGTKTAGGSAGQLVGSNSKSGGSLGVAGVDGGFTGACSFNKCGSGSSCPGASHFPGGLGGAAGDATSGQINATWYNTGTRYGTVG